MSADKPKKSYLRLSAFIGGLIVLVALGVYSPTFRHIGLKLVGRAPDCPWSNTLAANDNRKAEVRYDQEFLKASRVVENDPAGYHLVETPRGRWWIPAGNDYVLPFNLAEQEREIYGSGNRTVHPGDTVLDCGGNVGTFTRTALNHGAKLVVAFEPAPENIESYRRNFKDEIAAGKVILVPKGVWDKEDVLLLKRDPHNTAADSFVMLQDGSQAVQAPLTTVDHAVAELKLDRVDYVKMDIEGAEVRALQGARETIAKFHPRMAIATEHLPADAVTIPKAVRRIWPGYRSACGPCEEMKDGHIRPDVIYFE